MFKKPPTDQQLQKEIDRLYHHLNNSDPKTDEYAKINSQLSRLYALKENNSDRRVKPDTWANIVAYLAGIALIVGYERVHPFTSKALPFISKLR